MPVERPSKSGMGGWELVRPEPLGTGRQGSVFLARRPEARQLRGQLLQKMAEATKRLVGTDPQDAAAVLADVHQKLEQLDDPKALGAVKVYDIPDGKEGESALARLDVEIKALAAAQEPGLLRLLKGDLEGRLLISEYHPGRLTTLLKDKPETYRGHLPAALRALRPIVAGVASLHGKQIVHRDIKPDNILVASDGRLVLGDFGIVIFRDAEERLTEVFDQRAKGTRDWMAPWAYVGERVTLDEIDGTFDVFPLGKVLWVMLSGKRILPLWYHDQPEYDLEKLFPGDAQMPLANEILRQTVVQWKKDCLPSAAELLKVVDDTLTVLGRGGEPLRATVSRPCRVCGRGDYKPQAERFTGSMEGKPLNALVYICNACGHVQLFAAHPGHLPKAWKS